MKLMSNSQLRIGNKDSQQNYTVSRNNKRVSENDAILEASTTGVITEVIRDLNFASEMELWLSALTEDLAGGQTLTIKFYKAFGNEKYLAETVSVTSPAVTASTSAKVEVVPVDADLDSYDFYAISGTVTVAAGGTCGLLVGKKSQG